MNSWGIGKTSVTKGTIKMTEGKTLVNVRKTLDD